MNQCYQSNNESNGNRDLRCTCVIPNSFFKFEKLIAITILKHKNEWLSHETSNDTASHFFSRSYDEIALLPHTFNITIDHKCRGIFRVEMRVNGIQYHSNPQTRSFCLGNASCLSAMKLEVKEMKRKKGHRYVLNV